MFVEVFKNKIEVIDNNLYLGNLGIKDISQIKGLEKLTELKNLNLFANQIKIIQGIESLDNLTKLRIGQNLIPKDVLEECGGIDEKGYAKNPIKFVDYSSTKKATN